MCKKSQTLAAAILAGVGLVANVGPLRAAQDDAAKPQAGQQADQQAGQQPTQAQGGGQSDAAGGQVGAKQTTATHLPAGFKLKEKRDDPVLISNAIDSITEAAIKGDFNDVTERLVDQDRNRIGKLEGDKQTDLKDAQRRVRDAWKAKYNKEFDFNLDRDKLAANVFIIEGEVEDPAVAMTNWPLPPAGEQGQAGRASREASGGVVSKAATEAREATDNARQAAGNVVGNRSKQSDQKDSNIEKGRDVAVAAFPASHGVPGVRVSMIQEATGYRVDVPNSLTGEELSRNLAQQLRQFADHSAQWPDDVNQAQVAAAHHVLAGVYGVSEQSAGGRGQGAGGTGGTGASRTQGQ
jgi:hypothetical protein